MTIGDKTAMMETGLKPKTVELSELIRERKDKLVNLSLFQNGSQRIILKSVSFLPIHTSCSYTEKILSPVAADLHCT